MGKAEESKTELGPFGSPPVLPDETLDPFVNGSCSLDDPFELAKTIVMFPIFVVRAVFFISLMIVGVVFGHVALAGWKKGSNV